MFYPEAEIERCTAALALDLDPLAIFKGRAARGSHQGSLAHYVNDRPYVASSFLSVAIAEVFSSALNGTSWERPELAETPIPLSASLSTVPCKGGEQFIHELFEPLGYSVEAELLPIDEEFADWGNGDYYAVELKAICTLRDLLSHLYVLLPVLDNHKHYWIGQDEMEKLQRLRSRSVSAKRPLAMREYLLGLESLNRFVENESLYRVHECVFGILALESEPVDPRL